MTKILIVDDNEQSLYMLKVLLEGRGYEVVSAANGAEALDKARRDPPDVIITDILMPVMDGFTLCREWKKDGVLKAIPFVFYTATYTDPKDEEFAFSLGAERFIVKPVEPDVFVEMLREVIREAEAGRLVAPREPVEEEAVFFREYNEALIRKLEDKMVQLKEANRALKRDIAKRKRAEEALREAHDKLEKRVRERTAELQEFVNLMAGREVRMIELKDVIRQLRAQLEEAGLTPVADDPLRAGLEGYGFGNPKIANRESQIENEAGANHDQTLDR